MALHKNNSERNSQSYYHMPGLSKHVKPARFSERMLIRKLSSLKILRKLDDFRRFLLSSPKPALGEGGMKKADSGDASSGGTIDIISLIKELTISNDLKQQH